MEKDSAPSIFRTSSISTLFGRKRQHSDDEDETTVNNDSESDSENELNHKKRKTENEVKRQIFLEKEKEYNDELPEEYRKFRPTGYRFQLPPKDRPVRIYADGVFDLFHLGHMRQLEQAKKSLPNVELIVGVPSDVETHRRKGLTVLSDYQRCETLKHCKWVDEVIPNAPWCVTTEFLLKHKIDYVAHDDLPYASGDDDDIYKPIKEKGMFLTTQRTEGISTSDIITKIIRDYDKYLMRNFARGATRQELNVSWLKKNELEFKKHINEFRSYWKKTNDNLNNASRDLYFEVREYLLKKSILKDDNKKKKKIINDDDDDDEDGPAEQFAADFTGEYKKKARQQSPSFIESLKDWMQKTDSELSDKESIITTKSKKKRITSTSSDKTLA